jgi:hypothetical protein
LSPHDSLRKEQARIGTLWCPHVAFVELRRGRGKGTESEFLLEDGSFPVGESWYNMHPHSEFKSYIK